MPRTAATHRNRAGAQASRPGPQLQDALGGGLLPGSLLVTLNPK